MARDVRTGIRKGMRTLARGARGRATKRRPSSYRELGRLGGEAVMRTRGREFFREIGRKGGKKGGLVRKRQLQGP